MTDFIKLFVVLTKTVTLLLGGLITYFSYRAYLRTQHRPLGAFSLGFAVVTAGALTAGVAQQLFEVSLLNSVLINSLLTMAGFAIITYSLYIE